MPIRLNNTAEGGTPGQAITVGTASTTGALSGSAFLINRGTNSTIVFTSQAAHGACAYDLTIAAGEAAYLQWDTGDPSVTVAARCYLTFDTAIPATSQEVMSIRPSTGQVAVVVVTPTGMLRILSSTGATLATGTVAMVTGTTYRVELLATADTDGDAVAEGAVTAAYYVGDSTTAQDTLTVTGTAGTGTAPGQVVRFGRSGANTNAWRYRLDDLAAQTGATAFIGPYSTAVNSTTTSLAAESGSLVLLTGNPADTGAWTQTAGTPTVTIGGDPVNGTFDAPVLLTDTVLTFTRGTVTANVTVLKAPKRRSTAEGIRPVLTTRVTQLDPNPDDGTPDDAQMLAVTNLRGFQVPGTRHSRLEWTDLNAPRAASYAIRETTGGLNTSVTTQFRESTNLAVGDYVYSVTPVSATGATGPATAVQVSIVAATTAPTIVSGTPTIGTRTWSNTHTATPAVTVATELRRVVDGPVVATFNQSPAVTSITESYTGLEPGTQYIRTATFTRADNGATAVQSGTFTTGQATATVKYERLAPVLATDASPLPADAVAAGWRKVRVLSRSTYTVDDGPTQGFSGNISLPAGTNNLVILPRAATLSRNGGFTLGGGNHLSVRGGEVNSNWMTDDWYWFRNGAPAYGQTQRKGMQFNQQTGHIEAEGLYIHGPHLNDALWVNTAATTVTGGKRYVTLQNCLFTDVRAPSTDAMFGRVDEFGVNWALNTLHEDDLQLMGNGTNTVVRLYQCLFESAYQGIMDNMGEGVELEMERVHFNMTLVNTNGSQSIGYAVFLGGPVRIGPDVTVRNPQRLNGNLQQRQVGYPETAAKWAGIEQIVTTTSADPTWRAAAWAGDKMPGQGYVVS